jgi:hypothetical protein
VLASVVIQSATILVAASLLYLAAAIIAPGDHALREGGRKLRTIEG